MWPEWEFSEAPKDGSWIVARHGLSWNTSRVRYDKARVSPMATASSDRSYGEFVDENDKVVVVCQWHPDGEDRAIPNEPPPELAEAGGFVQANGARINGEHFRAIFDALKR